MSEGIKLPVGVTVIPTTTVKTVHTTLTEVVNGKVLKRLAITEPRGSLKGRIHRHLYRDDYICLLSGKVTLTTFDGKTYAKIPMKVKEDVLMVPRGIWHGYVTKTRNTVIIEASTEAFDPTDTEEFEAREPT